MISYLKGYLVDIAKNSANKIILILEVNQVGYEIQIPSRLARQLSDQTENIVQIFTHLQVQDDRSILYGFATATERELFRQLISVSGIGTQSAIALIDTLGLEDLVRAIVAGNIKALSQAPGIGPKTAERLALELKNKLAQWRQLLGITVTSSAAVPAVAVLEELEMTLLALGYTNQEINQAVSALSQDNQMLKNKQIEDWIKAAIAWLAT